MMPPCSPKDTRWERRDIRPLSLRRKPEASDFLIFRRACPSLWVVICDCIRGPPCHLDRGLRGLGDCADYPATPYRRYVLRTTCALCPTCTVQSASTPCLNRGLRGFRDFTDYPTPHTRYGLRTTCDLRPTCAALIRVRCPTYGVCVICALRPTCASSIHVLCPLV